MHIPTTSRARWAACLAKYAAAGEDVVVITGTDGAEGEIHNYDDPESLKPQLIEMRAQEMKNALAILGVTQHEFLGYRDSGMMGTEPNENPTSFWQADFMDATAKLIGFIRQYQPEVLTIYDPFGGYGHPDHIQVHRIGIAAYFGAADEGRFPIADGEEPWRPHKLYWTTWPRSRVQVFAKHRFEAGLITEEEYEGMQRGRHARRRDHHHRRHCRLPRDQADSPSCPSHADSRRLVHVAGARGAPAGRVRHRDVPTYLQPRRRTVPRDRPVRGAAVTGIRTPSACKCLY